MIVIQYVRKTKILHLVLTLLKVKAVMRNVCFLPVIFSVLSFLPFMLLIQSGIISPCMCLSSCLNLNLQTLSTFITLCKLSFTTWLCAPVVDFNWLGQLQPVVQHSGFVCLNVSSMGSRLEERKDCISVCTALCGCEMTIPCWQHFRISTKDKTRQPAELSRDKKNPALST